MSLGIAILETPFLCVLNDVRENLFDRYSLDTNKHDFTEEEKEERRGEGQDKAGVCIV